MWFTAKGAAPKKEEPHRPIQVYNPYMPSNEYVPDGEPHVFGDRVYVYGSHDVWGGETFCLGDYVCYSAPVNNLKDWRLEGTIYRKTQDPLNEDGHMCLYAPDVTQGPDGRYYLYYVLDKVSVVSVAVCDTPAGEYQFYGYVHDTNGVRLGDRPTDEPQFDPGVLTEGDKTYLYTGFCGHGDKSRHGAMATVLGPDMLTIVEEPKFIVPGAMYSEGSGFEGHAFFEAPSIRKVGDKYCFVYSSQVMHELCYAMSDQPTSGFTYGGVVVSNCDLGIDSYKPADLPMAYGANNHGGIVKIGEQWYIFYHRHTNGTWFQRQGCAEPIRITENGTKIPQVEITSCGLNGGPLAGIGYYPAYIACHMFTDVHSIYVGGNPADGANRRYPKIMQEGVGVTASEGYVANMTKNATVGFKYFTFEDVKKISIYTRGYANGVIEVRTKYDGEVLATLPVSSANIWTESTADIELNGTSALYLTFNGTGTASLSGVRFSK
ncbi:MAG: family 43 glycosylhydrolase [Lachnospiraceae bacterium]|nr:family 43 glycosylhydrolase [Lachnospiraceae bacterium]